MHTVVSSYTNDSPGQDCHEFPKPQLLRMESRMRSSMSAFDTGDRHSNGVMVMVGATY